MAGPGPGPLAAKATILGPQAKTATMAPNGNNPYPPKPVQASETPNETLAREGHRQKRIAKRAVRQGKDTSQSPPRKARRPSK